MTEIKTRRCIHCDGSGKQIDDKATGAMLRAARKAADISQSEVARSMRFCKAYVHDLEKGKRHWTKEKISAYQQAIA